jgi:DNA-binding response OmpR family regulator
MPRQPKPHPLHDEDERIASTDLYDDGYLRVEHGNYYAECAGSFIKLSRTEFLILSCLVRTPERIVQSEDLWKYAWAETKKFNPVSLHVYIYRLRLKLGPFGLNIETLVNVGYRLLLAKPAKKENRNESESGSSRRSA